MKTNIQKKVSVILLSFLTILVFTIISCQKEQQLTQPAQTDSALHSNSVSSKLSSEILLVTGGGNGTFGTDLDGDGDIDGSHFGMAISIFGDGSAKGHFECNMAGNADILGLPLMAVEGKVTNGSANAATGTATLTGTATVNLADGVAFRGVQDRK